MCFGVDEVLDALEAGDSVGHGVEEREVLGVGLYEPSVPPAVALPSDRDCLVRDLDTDDPRCRGRQVIRPVADPARDVYHESVHVSARELVLLQVVGDDARRLNEWVDPLWPRLVQPAHAGVRARSPHSVRLDPWDDMPWRIASSLEGDQRGGGKMLR